MGVLHHTGCVRISMNKHTRRGLSLLTLSMLATSANATPLLPLDSDHDGIPDVIEIVLGLNIHLADSDGDGKLDGLEINLDLDLDGFGDAMESSIVDTDLDGVNDEADPDNFNACVPAVTAGACDSDNDGVSNILEWERGTDHADADSDDDGIFDFDEGTGDADLDGVLDALEHNGRDCDEDGLLDHLDDDSDEDGVKDGREFVGDSDGDGIADVCDDDDDNDGIATRDELLNGFVNDRDDDGIADHLDDDSDNDGVSDSDEGLGDVDHDGVPNAIDADDTDGPGPGSDSDGEAVVDEAPTPPADEPAIDEPVVESPVEEEQGEQIGTAQREPRLPEPLEMMQALVPARAPIDNDDGIILDTTDAAAIDPAVSCAASDTTSASSFALVLAALAFWRRRR